ncbi:MAG: efflux RND transporter periplasmic adaptor subunit [Proteobacteria bacterium]|nr:efflux RND transporter periplasmic adaptor subunit [Pseudomonadota bacterium]MBS0501873.1 efflux RND transporter periplasmic adaptor subunit [Pseudomonadota bacterium]
MRAPDDRIKAFFNSLLNVGFTDITAPIDGRAGRILVQPGNLVKANDTGALLTINQIAPIYVTFAIPGDAVARVRAAKAADKLTVRVGGDGLSAPTEGAVAFVDNAVDPATNTVKLRARFGNTDERLWPGQFVKVALNLRSDADAITVPDAAVKSGPEASYVFVVDAGVAHQRDVVAGRSVDGRTLIASGLHAGQTVVVDGQSRLADGARVRVVDAAASGAADGSPP